MKFIFYTTFFISYLVFCLIVSRSHQVVFIDKIGLLDYLATDFEWPNFFSMNTGAPGGIYHQAGLSIKSILEKNFEKHQYYLNPIPSSGSVENINSLIRGRVEFAIAQSDRHYQAYYGEREWQKLGPQTDLRSVIALHHETITLISNTDKDIQRVGDVRGKNVNVGVLGSGQRENAIDVLQMYQVGADDFKPFYWDLQPAFEELKQNRIDAIFYTVGHPNRPLEEATRTEKNKLYLVPIVGPEIDAILEKYPYYGRSVINIRSYPFLANTRDIHGLAVRANLITSRHVDSFLVYTVTKEIVENLEVLQNSHPALNDVTPEHLFKTLSSPLHAGALRYFIEKGWLKNIPKHLIAK
jgi:TRAP transporter TAXI family solute receptor